MPLYEYECDAHGVFEQLRSLSEYGAPAPCPDCGAEVARVVSTPLLACVSRETRIARDRNEKSQYEPRMVQTRADPSHPAHAVNRVAKRPTLQRSTGRRPWVIEHG
ncbi:MAG: zinc ribbon domain-containing protein [Polyangiales bacterium]